MGSIADKSGLANVSSDSVGLTRLEATELEGEAHNTNLLDATMPDLPKLDLSHRWTKMPQNGRNSGASQSTPPTSCSKVLQTIGNSTRQTSISSTDRTGGWTPSPDQSTSRRGIKASSRSSLASNESMGSSLGTFDYSNASFSESFLRRAGAHMLAGLKETPQPASSSPTAAQSSSSPTVRGTQDPRTPHISKAWQTRLLEAANLASPGSSEGSSPASSLGLKTPMPSRFKATASYDSPFGRDDQPTTKLVPGQTATDDLSTELESRQEQEASSHPMSSEEELNAQNWQSEDCLNVVEGEVEPEAQGLSVVVEESFEQELSRMVEVEESKNTETSPETHDSVSSPAQQAPLEPRTSSLPVSAQASLSTPPTALRLRPRASPKAITRLKQVTPIRSPLSKVVSPESTFVSSTSAWESPSSMTSATKSASSVLELKQSKDTLDADRIPSHGESPRKGALVESPQSTFHSFAASTSFKSPPEGEARTKASFFTPSSSHSSSPASLPQQRAHISPAVYDTPSWTPSPTYTHQTADISGDAEEEDERAQHSTSSASSSSSEKKEGGDDSHHDDSHHQHDKDTEMDMSTFESPSVVRNTKLQLQRRSGSGSTSLSLTAAGNDAVLGAVPELRAVTAVFDKLSSLHALQSSVAASKLEQSRSLNEQLGSQLDAALTVEIDLRAAHVSTAEQLIQLQSALSQLSAQYNQLLEESEAKDERTAELLKSIQNKVRDRSSKGDEASFEQLFEEERRKREIERRDYEVRLSAMSRTSPSCDDKKESDSPMAIWISEQELQARIEEAKDQARTTAQKDFEIRHSIEMRPLLERIARLEAQPESSTRGHMTNKSAEKLHEDLTAQLDSREEEVMDLRAEIEILVSQKEANQDRIRELEEELDSRPDESQGEEELQDLRNRLDDRDADIQRLQETLELTQSQLQSVTAQNNEFKAREKQLNAELSALTIDAAHKDASTEAEQRRVEALEQRNEELKTQILSLEYQLRSHSSPQRPDSSKILDDSEGIATQQQRIKKLERQVADLDLQLVKLQKANEALQADNMISSIALSAKQLELGMVKRNARFALKASSSRSPAKLPAAPALNAEKHGQKEGPQFPVVPTSAFVSAADADKENRPVPKVITAPIVNNARLQARQMLALRHAQTAQEPRQLLAA